MILTSDQNLSLAFRIGYENILARDFSAFTAIIIQVEDDDNDDDEEGHVANTNTCSRVLAVSTIVTTVVYKSCDAMRMRLKSRLFELNAILYIYIYNPVYYFV